MKLKNNTRQVQEINLIDGSVIRFSPNEEKTIDTKNIYVEEITRFTPFFVEVEDKKQVKKEVKETKKEDKKVISVEPKKSESFDYQKGGN